MSFENTVGKGEIARNEQFLLFPQCFLPYLRTTCHFYQISNCRLQNLSIWTSLKFVVWERVNPYQNKALAFMYLQYTSFDNTVEKGEIVNLFVTSKFSFFHVFYPFGELSIIFIKFEFVVCKVFRFGKVSNLSFWKGITIVIFIFVEAKGHLRGAQFRHI